MPINSSLQQALDRREVSIDEIYLDPRNPRLAEHRTPRDHEEPIQDSVQLDIIETLYEGPFDMEQIEESIRYNGYVGTDVIVLRPYKSEGQECEEEDEAGADGVDEGETVANEDVGGEEESSEPTAYIVVEGNRRIAAMKKLREKYGESTPDELQERMDELESLDVLVADTDQFDSPETELSILQGLRHISGTKEWGPYQKAIVIEQLYNDGLGLSEIESRLGMSTTMVKRYRRSYSAAKQFQEDDEFGDQWQPNHFSFFEETIKRPDVREWMGWDDDEYEFTEHSRRRQFYQWFLGDESGSIKISRAIDVRKLSEIIAYDDKNKHLKKLQNQDETTVEGIYAQIEAEREKMSLLEMDWERELREMEEKLESLPASYISKMSEEESERLENLRDQIEDTLTFTEQLQN